MTDAPRVFLIGIDVRSHLLEVVRDETSPERFVTWVIACVAKADKMGKNTEVKLFQPRQTSNNIIVECLSEIGRAHV